MSRYVITILTVAIAIGILTGSFILYITWQHNPQCEFHCEGEIHWRSWLTYGLLASLSGFIGGIPIGLLSVLATALLKGKRSARKMSDDASTQVAMWLTLKRGVTLLWISLLLSLGSSWVPARVIDIVPGSEDCHTGCLAAAAGWPVAYIVDGHGLSPGGSADLIGMLLGLDRLDGPRAVGNWLFWLVVIAIVRAGLAAWRKRAR